MELWVYCLCDEFSLSCVTMHRCQWVESSCSRIHVKRTHQKTSLNLSKVRTLWIMDIKLSDTGYHTYYLILIFFLLFGIVRMDLQSLWLEHKSSMLLLEYHDVIDFEHSDWLAVTWQHYAFISILCSMSGRGGIFCLASWL